MELSRSLALLLLVVGAIAVPSYEDDLEIDIDELFDTVKEDEAIDYSCPAVNYTNGCSVPIKSFPFVKTFEPACLIHDVCYRCVRFFSSIANDIFDVIDQSYTGKVLINKSCSLK